jgi:hypothetical protein
MLLFNEKTYEIIQAVKKSGDSRLNLRELAEKYSQAHIQLASDRGYIAIYTRPLPRISGDDTHRYIQSVKLTRKGERAKLVHIEWSTPGWSNALSQIVIGLIVTVLGGLILYFVFGVGKK